MTYVFSEKAGCTSRSYKFWVKLSQHSFSGKVGSAVVGRGDTVGATAVGDMTGNDGMGVTPTGEPSAGSCEGDVGMALKFVEGDAGTPGEGAFVV
jgi:hypothetical protein